MSIEKVKVFISELQKEVLTKDLLISKLKKSNEEEKKVLLLSIIEILDDFNQLLSKKDRYFHDELMEQKGPKKFVKALQRIEKTFLEMLSSYDVVPIALERLDIPDPKLCQIVDTSTSNSTSEEGRISLVIKMGYLYKNQVLRLSQVTTYQRSSSSIEGNFSKTIQ